MRKSGAIDARERRVLYLRDTARWTYRAIGESMELTTERIRQMYARATRISRSEPHAFDVLTTATRQRLERYGVSTAEQVRALSDTELLDIPLFGLGMLLEVRSMLKA